MVDKDYLARQYTFSDTSSDVGDGRIAYGIIDVGVVVARPTPNARLGVFVGYHYWHDKVTAHGLSCNCDDVGGFLCGPPGTVVIPYDVAVLTYEPTWHAARIGFDGQCQLDSNWSVTGELAVIPYAWLQNDDSHLLRQSAADLGPAPNIISRNDWSYGAEAEVFVNYALTNNLELGFGFRYSGLFTYQGDVEFGPNFSPSYPLGTFYQQRCGVLLQLKGTILAANWRRSPAAWVDCAATIAEHRLAARDHRHKRPSCRPLGHGRGPCLALFQARSQAAAKIALRVGRGNP